MAPEPDDDRPRDDDAARARAEAARRAAQDGAAELARMGIDPGALGLEPPPVPGGDARRPGPPDPAGRRTAEGEPGAGGSGWRSDPGAGSSRPTARGVATPPAPARSSPLNGRPPATGRHAPPPPALATPPTPPLATAGPVPPAGPMTYRRSAAGVPPPPPPQPAPAWLDSTLSRPIAAIPQPPAPAGGGPLEPLERLLPAPPPGLPGAWRGAVRAVTLGLVEPGAAAAAEYERQLVARVRIRRPEPRLVTFLAGKGGVGTTTVAAGIALTLASLRADTTALVSARSGAGSLSQRLLGHPAPPVPAPSGGEPGPPALWVNDRLAVVDGPPWHSPIPRGSLVGLLERLRGQHPHTIVDVGNDLGEPAEAALGRADQIVLVTSASQDGVAATRTALSRVHQIDPFRLATVVVAVTCLSEHQYRRTVRRLPAALGMQRARVVPVGFDPWLSTGDRLDPARIRATTRAAYLRIAGMVVDPGRAEQWFSQPSGAGAGR